MANIAVADDQWVQAFDPGKTVLRGETYLFVKRLMDLSLVILTLPAWLPLIGIISLMVWLEAPGARIFFSQKRTGKGGQRFEMYKFRTMVPNAEELKHCYMHLNELQWPDFKITNDPRITRVGKILRKTSLDELPQILNVIKGEMSIVGPRPTSFSSSSYKLWHTERLDVLPGLTGLWQITGRASTEFDDRLRLDITYIEKRCIWLDVQIIFRTILAVFSQRGAH